MDSSIQNFSNKELAALLPWPTNDTNKYTRGLLCLVAGSAAYPGAACLAASAATRMGAGYVRVSCAGEVVPVVRGWQASLVVSSWSEEFPRLAAREGKPQAYTLGPGFDVSDGRCKEVSNEVLNLATRGEVPMLIDGGALGILSKAHGIRRIRRHAATGAGTILTPHGGEGMRLANACGIDSTGDSPSKLAHTLCDALSATIVLKGPDTHIVSPDGRTFVMSEGTSALAKAGTGDVLAGMIGSLLAQGLDAFEASVLGATLHARAGIAAADKLTEICVTPEDVIDTIPDAIKSLCKAI